MRKSTIKIGKFELTADMLGELKQLLDTQDTTDASFNEEWDWAGEHASYKLKIDKEGNVKLNGCERYR